ncbi:Putative membrane protein [Sphingopyxis fribergensis]|uniref:Putative membrane protein n=1 Tax=Sphingopyxis fribergensis TaxID=1515612 RepID=A0A0A7PEL5_9SPHN|nr:FecR domain-containing protein [Sphingopyxis fribergensis]AJA08546.1 Putative membrane protein [Sphingopyxis fribergensis]
MSRENALARAALRSEAAQWFNLERSGDMTVDDEHRFHDWLEQSDAHRDAYRLVERAWIIAGTIPQEPEMLAAAENDFAHGGERSHWRRHLALAASLLLIFTVSWVVHQNGFFGFGAAEDQRFRTGIGQTSTVTLAEGSVVTLDAETEMRVSETPRERRVDLVGGRAFFRVAKDASRPFIVNAGGKSVRAIGTAFEVSFEHGNMVVTLAEGKVRVEEASAGTGSGTDMVPGGQLVIGADHNWTLRRVDVAKETSWTEGRLIFMRDPLSDAVAEMNRYSPRKLVFKDGRIPEKEVVGVFEAGDVEGFVKAMELNGIAQRVSATDEEILLSGSE